MNRRTFLASAVCYAAAPELMGEKKERPLFSFGLAADIQYADKDTANGRAYRDSIDKLRKNVAFWNTEDLAFVIQLGDFVDTGGRTALDQILPIYNETRAKKYSVLGNHDFTVPRDQLLQRLNMPSAYYDFNVLNWRFIVLDGMNISVKGGWGQNDPHAQKGREVLARLAARHAPNANDWNGGVGLEQRQWLQRVLTDANRKGERAIVFCHFPTLPASCRPSTLLWDHEEVLAGLENQRCVAAYINGHDHQGGYASRKGVHYLTLPAVVEHDVADSCFAAHVFPHRIVIQKMSGSAQTLLL
jgi:hypothetical protein